MERLLGTLQISATMYFLIGVYLELTETTGVVWALVITFIIASFMPTLLIRLR